MKIASYCGIAILACMMTGCATTKKVSEMTAEDRSVLTELKAEVFNCVVTNLDKYKDGSDDVALLSKVAVNACEHTIHKIAQETIDRGYSYAASRGFLSASSEYAEQTAIRYLLSYKAKKKAEIR